MSRTAEYCELLKRLDDWVPTLEIASGLPGPRANLELAHAAAQTGTARQFDRLLSYAPAESDTPREFLVFCGLLGLGRLAGEGDTARIEQLRIYANDASWRIREAASTALQLTADGNRELWLRTALQWSKGTWLEKRAAAAALAEPRLLKNAPEAGAALGTIHAITISMSYVEGRSTEEYRVLRKAMGYCWSVVVAALPGPGKALMETWFSSPNLNIRWIMLENLKKDRLLKNNLDWVMAGVEKLKIY